MRLELSGEPEARSASLSDKGRFVLWYHGSIVPSQLPKTVVRCLPRYLRPSN